MVSEIRYSSTQEVIGDQYITGVQLTYRSLGSSIVSYHNYKDTDIEYILFFTGSRDRSARNKTLSLFIHPHVIPNWKDFCE